jgi:hypothetical protein
MEKMIRTGFFSVILLLFIGTLSAEVEAFQVTRPIAVVRRFKPEVTVSNLEADKFIKLDLSENLGEKLFNGDSLLTNEEGFALVFFMDRSIAKVKPNSMLIVNGKVGVTSKVSNTRINLKRGEIFLDVAPQGSNDFEVATSRSLASVKGTQFGSKSDGYFWVQEGQVDVTALTSGQTVSLFEKMFAKVDDQGNEIESGTLSSDELAGLNQGYDEMDKDLIKKQIILRFRDQNGQIREIKIDAFEKGQN